VVNAPITTQGNMFTYSSVGRQISDLQVAPFWELLFGAQTRTATRTRSKGFATTSHAFHPLQTSAAPHPFTMALGGGLDIKVSTNFSIRPIEIDTS